MSINIGDYLNKNLYEILQINSNSNLKEIKKSYYILSKKYHPDINKEISVNIFSDISNAYHILIDDGQRKEYDLKSKWGKNYDESIELLNFEFNNDAKTWNKEKLEKFKQDEILNVIIYIDDTFNGNFSYERWVLCKKCNGSGKDEISKFEIKDENGKIIKMFESEDGCDFCEGTGKDWIGNICTFCFGNGKMGCIDCKTCKGEKRILGKQNVSNIKFPINEENMKLEFMGHCSKTEPGKIGHLFIVKKKIKD